MYQTDKCVVAQVLKVVVIINLIIIDHSRMIQAFRFIEISKYDDGGQLMQGSSRSFGIKPCTYPCQSTLITITFHVAVLYCFPAQVGRPHHSLRVAYYTLKPCIIKLIICNSFHWCTITYLSFWEWSVRF